MDLELHRNLERPIARIEARRLDVILEIPQQRRRLFRFETGGFEIGRQSDMQDILWLIRRTECLRR